MPLNAIGPIFQGVTPPGARKALKKYLEKHYTEFDTFMVPCVGLFALPEAMVEAGVKPEKLVCSDITLFSSALGYALDPSKDVVDLKFKSLSDEITNLIEGLPNETQAEKAATIFVAQKYTQLNSKSEFVAWQRKQLVADRAKVHEEYRAGVDHLYEKLGGLRYEIRDAHPHVHEYVEDSKCFIWYNPPAYKGGYTKMYDPQGKYEWAEPTIPEIVMEDVSAFVDTLYGRGACINIYSEEWYPLSILESEDWYKLYVEPYGKTKRWIYVLTNREPDMNFTTRGIPVKKTIAKPPKVYDDHEITMDTKISMVQTSSDVALYFYDLFVRELGMVKASGYYLFCLDGQVVGTCGFDIRDLMIRRTGVVYETFGLTMTSLRYQRVNRLLMRYITGQEFINQFTMENLPDGVFLPPIGILQTTCLSKYPEVKTNRGILKLIKREKFKGTSGKFHLIYRAKIHQMTQEEILKEWIGKHAKYHAKEYVA